jgi:hypothetical protein
MQLILKLGIVTIIDSDDPLFRTLRSKRFKTFLDIRRGNESLLKCLVAYFEHENPGGLALVKRAEGFRHNKLLKR